jgi:hypothetical protein
MSFLDDLKRQAGSLKAQDSHSQQSLLRTTQLVDAAARVVQHYLMELASNLDVIRPLSKRRYALDRGVVVEAFPLVDFRYDARRKIVLDQEVIDHVRMSCSVRSGRKLRISKDFVNEMELLERRLDQALIKADRESIRHPDNGKLVEVSYAFVADVGLSAHLRCDHERGLLHFKLRNLDGLETVECEFAPHLMVQAKLDELARWWVGEPHCFLDGAAGLRRTEAR